MYRHPATRNVLSRTPPADGHAASEAHWTERGVDRLFPGDEIRIRQFEPAIKGLGSHGQAIVETKRRGTRETVVHVETATYGLVTSVGSKAGRTTVFYTVLGTTSLGRTGAGGSLSQADVVADNAVVPKARRREVRRLAGTGPSTEVRASTTPEAYSEVYRRAEFVRLTDALGVAAFDVLAEASQGDAWYDNGPVTSHRMRAWADGSERVPNRVLAILRAEVEARLAGEIEWSVATAPAQAAPAAVEDEDRDVAMSASYGRDDEDDDGFIYAPDDDDDWQEAA